MNKLKFVAATLTVFILGCAVALAPTQAATQASDASSAKVQATIPQRSPTPTPAAAPTTTLSAQRPLYALFASPIAARNYLVKQLRHWGPLLMTLTLAVPAVITLLAFLSLLNKLASWPLLGSTKHLGSTGLHQFLQQIWRLVGLLPLGPNQGLVFDAQTIDGVPLTTVIALRLFPDNSGAGNKLEKYSAVITDTDGFYHHLILKSAAKSTLWRLQVEHAEYHFPSAQDRSPDKNFQQFYLGESFEITSKQNEAVTFIIPVDPLQPDDKKAWHRRFNQARLGLIKLSQYSSVLIPPFFLISGIITILFPITWNWLVFSSYLVLMAVKSSRLFVVKS